MCVVYTLFGNEIKWSTFYVPPCKVFWPGKGIMSVVVDVGFDGGSAGE